MFDFFKKIWQWIIVRFLKKGQVEEFSGSISIEEKSNYIVIHMNDIPQQLVNQHIYIIGEPDFFWLAALKCPCQCGEVIQLNLLPEAKPRWKVLMDKNNYPSLSPSIWRKVGCKSHFLLKNGKIIWCNDDDLSIS